MRRVRTFYRSPAFATLEEAARWAAGHGGVFVEDYDGRGPDGTARGSCEVGLSSSSNQVERRSLCMSGDATETDR